METKKKKKEKSNGGRVDSPSFTFFSVGVTLAVLVRLYSRVMSLSSSMLCIFFLFLLLVCSWVRKIVVRSLKFMHLFLKQYQKKNSATFILHVFVVDTTGELFIVYS